MSAPSIAWTTATTSIEKAISGLLSALASKRNAWIEIQKNGEQSNPIKRKNPQLDNPFNWSLECQYIAADDYPKMEDFFNATEKDLHENWTGGYFRDAKSREHYIKTGEILPDTLTQAGISCPVRVVDWLKTRPDLDPNSLPMKNWRAIWGPLKYPAPGIPYWVTDDRIGDVFVVMTDSSPLVRAHAMRRLAKFLENHAEDLSFDS